MDFFEEIDRLEQEDKAFLWHPFTQMKDWEKARPVIITEAKDCFIKDITGKWYLDGVSSLWVNIHGHRREEINHAIKSQLDRVAHTTLLGLANVPSIELARRLVDIAPRGLGKVFYSDNGSTAVEVALKMAFQYWRHRGDSKRSLFVSLNNAYHGDTLGAMSVGGIDIFHAAFSPLLFRTEKAPSPYCYRCELGLDRARCRMACLDALEKILSAHAPETAAVIIEPLVQAAGGMIVAPQGYLKGVSDLCRKYQVLLIADEVATGFGRTGRMFACEHEEVIPDLICLSKGITGGYLPLAATLCTDEIYTTFLGEFDELKTFFHGHSYTGNQLGCSAALASLDLFEKDKTLEAMKPKTALLKEWLQSVLPLDHAGDVRTCGLMGGVELVRNKTTKEPYAWKERMGWKVATRAMEKGLFIRPLGNVIAIMPPLAISLENLKRMLEIIQESMLEATEDD
ncbi:MAG: adenosylmethionine--8-amino-7-oxononanoate transaminase [bacterium]